MLEDISFILGVLLILSWYVTDPIRILFWTDDLCRVKVLGIINSPTFEEILQIRWEKLRSSDENTDY